MLQETEIVGTEIQTPVEIAELSETSLLTADDIFLTNPLPVPPAIPDAHRATITFVEARHYDNEKGTVSLVVHLTSLDLPTLQTEFEIFLPKMFAENIKVDPTTLPDEPGNKQKTVYRMRVASADGRSTLQKLRKLAADAGRTIYSVGISRRSSNIDEYAENLSKLLIGLEVVFYREPDKDGEFTHRLRVRGIMPIDTVSKPKLLKKYQKAWESA